MRPTSAFPTTLAFFIAAGCSATDAPTVEFTNNAGKNDKVDLTFELDDGESIDIGLDCSSEEGCDIAIHAYDVVFGEMPPAIEVTLLRPDGFSRTDSLYGDESGIMATAFFAQSAGYHTVTLTNQSGEHRQLAISAVWDATRPDTSTPGGGACSLDSDCSDGQVCLGAGEGQSGFCSSSCATFGQLRCDQTGSLCVPLDEQATEAYCFNYCDPMAQDSCGGDHLECSSDAVTDGAGNPIDLCVPSAALEGSPEGTE